MERTPVTGYVLMAAALVAALGVIGIHDDTLRHGVFTSGYLLLGCVIFLAAFNLRKRLSFLPLGSASMWLKLHIYISVIGMVLFASHVDFRLPTGKLEKFLFFLFLTTNLSGLYGLYLTRTVPARLSKLRDEVLYERIPRFRAQVRRRAHEVVVDLLKQKPADTIADFYVSQLCDYFVTPRSVFYFLSPSSQLRNQLQGELANLSRYCSDSELEASRKLGRLIDQRDDLDYHQALQGQLKMWLFGHIGLTYVLLLIAILHAILAHAFCGGVA